MDEASQLWHASSTLALDEHGNTRRKREPASQIGDIGETWGIEQPMSRDLASRSKSPPIFEGTRGSDRRL